MEIRKESPDEERLYEYLHASDALLLQRRSTDGVVVSTTAFQCLGSGCPILASDSNFFENMDEVVLKYHNFSELKENLLDVFNKGERYRKTKKEVERFLKENSAEKVALRYIEFFLMLKRGEYK